MELLWLFGMSTKAYAWFIVILSGFISILLAIALYRDSNDWYYDFFGFPRPIEFSDEIDEIIIEIEKKSLDQPTVSQSEPSALPETISENLSASDTNHPTEKVSSEESSV